ncbi:MAG: PEP-CTERM sorting domain-containing protein [Alphaproteobacteria bacterium]|nr:PEP-CTERM sorting domain-containing protein [Alphaproteobacteria bacterium]
MTKLGRFLAVSALAALAAGAANAAPITYDEAIDGDLTQFMSLTLDTGVNTVTGTFNFLPGDNDNASIVVGPGKRLVGVTLDILGFTTTGTLSLSEARFGGGLYALPSVTVINALEATLIEHGVTLATSASLDLFSGDLADGRYLGGFTGGIATSGSGTLDVAYRWTYVVDDATAAVPAPASGLLLAAGLAGLGRIRKRRRA